MIHNWETVEPWTIKNFLCVNAINKNGVIFKKRFLKEKISENE
jgi:hypothetical protein